MLIKEIRLKLKLSQKEFSDRFEIPISTLRKWEQAQVSPSKYLINLLLKTTPELSKEILVIGKDNKTYFIDRHQKTIYDRHGNSIKYTGDIDKVNKNNLIIYLDNCFESLYNIQRNLNISIMRDPIDNIEWITLNNK